MDIFVGKFIFFRMRRRKKKRKICSVRCLLQQTARIRGKISRCLKRKRRRKKKKKVMSRFEFFSSNF